MKNSEIIDIIKEKLVDFEMDTFSTISDVRDYAYNHDGEEISSACSADWVRNGASKTVIYWEDLGDLVVKIPASAYDEDEENCHATYDGEYSSEDGWDYCALEEERCQALECEGLSEMVCRTWYVGEVYDTRIYVSQRADETWSDGSWNYRYTNSEEDLDVLAEEFGRSNSRMRYWREFIDAYGLDKCERLMEFFRDNDVNDLHNGNVAFRNGKPVFIDYSGYYE